MSVLIASDIHGAVSAAKFLTERVLERKPELVLLLGDHLYHGPRNKLPGTYDAAETARILTDLPAPVAALKGNCDAEVDQFLLPWTLAETSYLNLGGSVFLAIHGHQLPINGGNLKITPGVNIIHGHTHLPAADSVRGCHLWNPGSVSIPKGGFPASYGWYEKGVFQVLALSGEVIATDRLNG